MLRITRNGWRCRTYLAGRRIHHGTFGAILIFTGLFRPRLATAPIALGLALCFHDRLDVFDWFTFLREKDELR
jgi:hypothetical protein